MTLPDHPPLVTLPDASPHAAPGRATVIPLALPLIPKAAFPITSQEDLMRKISRLFLRAPFGAEAATEPGTPAGHGPPAGYASSDAERGGDSSSA